MAVDFFKITVTAARVVAETEAQFVESHVVEHTDEADIASTRVAERSAEKVFGIHIVDPHSRSVRRTVFIDHTLYGRPGNEELFKRTAVEFIQKIRPVDIEKLR